MSQVHVESVPSPAGGVVTTVTHDNESKLNCIDEPSAIALAAAIEEAGKNPDLRVMVFRGAGDRALIGGADINFMSEISAEAARPFITSIHDVCAAIRAVPVPVICRTAGYALGAGLEIAAACDIRIANDRAMLGMPEVQVGLPSVIEAALLPRLIGWGKTAYLVYTGESVDAETSLAWGLVEQVVKTEALDDAVAKVADAICRAGPHAIRLQKSLCRDWEELPLNDAIVRGIDYLPKAFASGEPKQKMEEFFFNRKR